MKLFIKSWLINQLLTKLSSITPSMVRLCYVRPLLAALFLMKTKSLLLILVLVAFKGSATETLCDKFRTFAESSTLEQPVMFKLESDWGNMSISCIHNQLKSEKQFCTWLVQNSSKEFMGNNVAGLEQCLTGHQAVYSTFSYTKKSASYSVIELAATEKNIEISVNYLYGSDISKPFLSVVVSRIID